MNNTCDECGSEKDFWGHCSNPDCILFVDMEEVDDNPSELEEDEDE